MLKFKKRLSFVLYTISIFFLVLFFYKFIHPDTFDGTLEVNTHADSNINVYGDKTLNQRYTSKLNSINNINFEIPSAFDGNLVISISSHKKNIIKETYRYDEIANNNNILSIFIPEGKRKFTSYDIEISCSDCSEKSGVVLKKSSSFDKKNSYLITNDSDINEGINFFVVGQENSYLLSFLFLVLFLFFIIFCFFITFHGFKKIKFRYFIFEFILFLIVIFLFLFNMCDKLYEGYFNFNLVIVNLIFGLLFIILFIKIFKNTYIRKEQLYLLIAIPVTITYSVFLMPNYVPDEPTHFWRAISLIEEGVFNINSRITIPNDYVYYDMNRVQNYNQLKYSLGMKPNYEKMLSLNTSASGYTIVLYPFVCLGIMIGKFFSLSIMCSYILARLLNIIAMLMIGYYVIKILPFGKNIAFIYLFNPMYLQQGASVSADSMVNSLCLLFIAYIFYMKSLEGKFSKKDNILFWIIVILLGFCKYIYIPLVLIVFMIFQNKTTLFKMDKTKIKVLIPVLLSISISLLSFYVLYLVPSSSAEISSSDINMLVQLKTILTSPKYTFRSLIGIFDNCISWYIDTFFGSSMGWFQIPINSFVLLIYRFLFITSPFIYNENEFGFLKKSEKIFSCCLTFFICFLVVLSMWLCWTPVGSTSVIGVQGRYFLPIIILGLLSISEKNKRINIKNYDKKVAIILLIVHILVIRNIISYFI